MAQNRKPRSDSLQSELAAHARAATSTGFDWGSTNIAPIDDPELAEIAMRVANDIYASRAADDWSYVDMTLISQLANVTVELDRCEQELRACGYLLTKAGKSGLVQVRHPLTDILSYLSGRQAKLITQLSLATKVDKATLQNGASLQRSAQATRTLPNGQQVNASSLLA